MLGAHVVVHDQSPYIVDPAVDAGPTYLAKMALTNQSRD